MTTSSDALQTYTASMAPPSIALAMMSWKRANLLSEVGGGFLPPYTRDCGCEACVMHYAMLDRITVGGAP